MRLTTSSTELQTLEQVTLGTLEMLVTPETRMMLVLATPEMLVMLLLVTLVLVTLEMLVKPALAMPEMLVKLVLVMPEVMVKSETLVMMQGARAVMAVTLRERETVLVQMMSRQTLL
jgi:hypothetical protein